MRNVFEACILVLTPKQMKYRYPYWFTLPVFRILICMNPHKFAVFFLCIATDTKRNRCNRYKNCFAQCSGSITFWCGSRSADPCLWLMNPDPDPDPGSGSCYFRHRPSRCQQKTKFFFPAYYFLKIRYIYIFFLKIKSLKESQNSRNQVFFTIFAWW